MTRYLKWEGRLASAVLIAALVGVLIFFYTPIATLIAFSFKESRFMSIPFEGWSLQWYNELLSSEDFLPALFHSFLIAVITTVVTGVIGTAGAIAWVRYNFRFKRLFQALAVLPLIFPQLLLGVMLLFWFSVLSSWLDFGPSMWTVIPGHVLYVTPFVLLIVSVQVYGLDDSLEQAARDAGAGEWAVFREITFPLIWPGVFAAMVFAFLLSWGNFYITYSLSGTTRTLPTFVFSGIHIGSSPVYPALATLTFVPALVLVLLADVYRRRGARRPKQGTPAQA